MTICLVTGALMLAAPLTIQPKEIYLVDGQPVLLYKIVNWWYTCLKTDTQLLCGSPLTVQDRGEIQVIYDNQARQLDFLLPKGVLAQLSLFKPANFSGNHRSLELVWQNPKFFPKDKGITLSPNIKSLGQLSITQIPRAEADLIKGMEHQLTLQIQGNIQGLINHKIALHPIPEQKRENRPGQDLILPCPQEVGFPPPRLSFSLILTQTLEVLVRYEMIWK